MPIDPGEMRHKIKFIRPAGAQDAEGYRVGEDTTVYTCRAAWRQESGREVTERDGDYGVERGSFIIRYHAGLHRKLVVLYRDKPYAIEYIDRYKDDRHWLKIQVKRETQAGDVT